MSKNLAKLLNKSEQEITKAITKLEAASGYPSHDVRIMAEIKQAIRSKLQQLGLDPDDTTGQELYWSLQARFDRDSQLINRAMGVNEVTALDERLDKAIQLVNHCARADEVWVVKNSVAKKMLAANPPKHLIKMLKYRSAASLIKRQDIAELYLLAAQAESATWQKTIDKELSKLNSADYELRPVKIIKLTNHQEESDDSVVIDKRLGTVAIEVDNKLSEAPVLSLTLLLLAGLQAVNSAGYREAIHELSPALRWWSDNNYLVADAEQPVSFNLKDIAINYLQNNNFDDAVSHHGAQSLWQELTDRYQREINAIADQPAQLDDELNPQDVAHNLPVSSELANEFITVE